MKGIKNLPPYLEQGKRLEQARATRYKTRAQGARAAGVNTVTYGTHERGERGMSSHDAALYARTFGVAAGWLLFGEDGGESGPDKPLANATDEVIGGVFEVTLVRAGLEPEAARAASAELRALLSGDIAIPPGLTREQAARSLADQIIRRYIHQAIRRG